MAFVVTLTAAGGAEADVGVVGGKGASLGELTRAGVAVPPGFVVTADAFAAALAVIDPAGARRAEIEAVPAGDLAGIAAVAARFRALVAGAPLPAEVAAAIEDSYAGLGGAGLGGDLAGSGEPDVAIRSSSTIEDSAEASFAGLQDTYLGIRGAAAVADHVRRCWASLYNDESVAYRRRFGLAEDGVAMAVVVQRMVAPRAAGVMFTRSPVTGDRSVVAIEGVWGLGSALVSGDVTPDSWIISKVTQEITSRRVSPKVKIHRYRRNDSVAPPSPADGTGPAAQADGTEQPSGPAEAAAAGSVHVIDAPPELRDAPCLTDEEIRALAALARRVEAHYGAPQDIEWALLDAPFAPAGADAAGGATAEAAGGARTEVPADARIVLLQSRPETVWAARESQPAGAPRPRAADHVLALFGKPL